MAEPNRKSDGASGPKLACLTFFSLIYCALIMFTAARFEVTIGHQRLYVLPDDVMITLRTAYNFAQGLGPYFNPQERVQAATSLFYPLLVSPLFKVFSQSDAVLALICLSTAAVLGLFLLLTLFSRNVSSLTVSLALLVFCPSLLTYGPTAWEHVPQAGLVTLGFLLFLGQRPVFLLGETWSEVLGVLCLSLAFLIRPDAAVLLIVPGLWLFRRFLKSKSAADLAVLTILMLFCLSYILAGLYYYDQVLPNSWYLKAGAGAATLKDGFTYFFRTIIKGGNTTFLLALWFLLFSKSLAWSAKDKAVVLSISLFAAYVIYLGGDVFSQGRFFLAVTPTIVFLIAEKTTILATSGFRTVPRPAAAVIFILLCVLPPASLIDFALTVSAPGRSRGRAAAEGKCLPDPKAAQLSLSPIIREKVRPADGDLGLFYLGALSFYLPEFQATDFLGRADPVIARRPARPGPIGHNKWDFDYSLSRRRVAVIPMFELSRKEAEKQVEEQRDFNFWAELVLHPVIQSRYRYLSAAELGLNHHWGLYVRKDLVDRFRPAPP
ncbi:MAG: hypothetical protein AB1641_12200 [Thermodesulfobacteriota bacterium]